MDNIRTDQLGPFAAPEKYKLGSKGVQKCPKSIPKIAIFLNCMRPLVGCSNLFVWNKLAGSGWIDSGSV